MTKAQKFVNNLTDVLNDINVVKVKKSIGDSTNNNRTLTVNQVIRYLTSRRKTNLKKLGEDLQTIYGNRKVRKLLKVLRTSSSRTDSVDVSEFLQALSVCVQLPSFTRSVGHTL